MAKLLIPVDSSETSKKAVEFALRLTTPGESLSLLHAILPIQNSNVIKYVGREQVREFQLQQAKEDVRSLEEFLAQKQVSFTLDYQFGFPAEVICSQAEHYDLVVMGTHGHGRLSGYLLGSVSNAVLARLKNPLILVPEETKTEGTVKKILVAVDGSDHAMRAAKQAIEIGKALDAHFVLLTVVALPVVYAGIDGSIVVWQSQEDVSEIGKQILEKYEPLFAERNVPFTARFVTGDPATEIRNVASETGADLIALGYRGMNWMAQAVMGSVTYRLIHGTELPLLIVK